MLPGEAAPATTFLQSKIRGQIRVNGNRIEIEDEKGLDVKLLAGKFLHSEGLTGYRVISQSGTLKVVPQNEHAPEKQPADDMINRIPPFYPYQQQELH